MEEVRNIIKFYRDCYAFDYRSFNITNFFSRKGKLPYVVDNAKILKDSQYLQKVEAWWGAKVEKELALHSKEISLYAGAFFLFGTVNQLGKTVKVAPPLYFYETQLHNKYGIYRIEFDLDNPIINPYFLEFIKIRFPSVNLSYEDFVAGLPDGPLDTSALLKLQVWLEEVIPTIDCTGISSWITNDAKPENARATYKQFNSSDHDRIIPGIALALLPKQRGAMGVINELEYLSQHHKSPSAISNLYLNRIGTTESFPSNIKVPFALSIEQKTIIAKAYQYPFTLVIGPPGSGKSYTIAALVASLVSEGKSVLVASKNEQAGKVVVQKLEDEGGLKGIIIKANRRSYKRYLGSRIKKLLASSRKVKIPTPKEVRDLASKVNQLVSELERSEKLLEKRGEEEENWGQHFASINENLLAKLKEKWIKYRFHNSERLWEIRSKLDKLNEQLNRAIKRWMKSDYESRKADIVRKFAKDFKHLIEVLESKSANAIDKNFDQIKFENILKAIPAWVIQSHEVHHILPLQEKIFDLLVIDEATQCDVASCLPLIYRAKHTVVIGDPKQLRHLSFISKQREEILNSNYSLNGHKYRDFSILDLFLEKLTGTACVTHLHEHYRSLPDIIEFSNQHFYKGSLQIMTDTPITRIHKNIYSIKVNGLRSKHGENRIEANKIIEKLRSVVDHEAAVERNLSSEIGIISTFRAQVTLLKRLVKQHFTLEEIQKHKLLIGTPFHFQGEERDIILISLAVDNESHTNAKIYLQRPDVFNVLISRARNLQIVYTSLEIKDLKRASLLRLYLEHIEAPRKEKPLRQSMASYDQFKKEVIATLENWKVDRIYSTYAIAGVMIDVVVAHNDRTFCIDLVGYPGSDFKMFDLQHQAILRRMKRNTFLLSYIEWRLERKKNIESLHDFIFNT